MYYFFLFFVTYVSLFSVSALYAYIGINLILWKAPVALFFNNLFILHGTAAFIFSILGIFALLCALGWAVRVQEANALLMLLFIKIGFYLFMATTILLIFFLIELISLMMFVILINIFFTHTESTTSENHIYWFNNALIILFWVSLIASLFLFIGLNSIITSYAVSDVVSPWIQCMVVGLLLKMGLPPLFLWKIDFMRGLHMYFLLFYVLVYYLLNTLFFFYFIIYHALTVSTLYLLACIGGASFLLIASSLQEISSLFVFVAFSSLINACVVLVILLFTTHSLFI